MSTTEDEARAEALASGLAKYGMYWWTTDVIRYIVSNIVEDGEPDADRASIAHEMWNMGAWLDHTECRNDPKLGNDADYENGCEACQQYLLVVADAILAGASRKVEVTDEMVVEAMGHRLRQISGRCRCSCGATVTSTIAFTRHVLSAALGGGES